MHKNAPVARPRWASSQHSLDPIVVVWEKGWEGEEEEVKGRKEEEKGR